MADYGFNFRATAGYVTDGANESAVLGINNNYPNSYGNGLTAGWEQSQTDSARDRDSGVDRRLAGLNAPLGVTPVTVTFRIDLPSTGTYDIELAAGDAVFSGDADLELRDNTTVFATISGALGGGGRFFDAQGTLHTSAAAWVSSQAPVQRTFTSTILRIALNPNADATRGQICHIGITAVGGGSNPVAKIFQSIIGG
jgi:hypothetical protein